MLGFRGEKRVDYSQMQECPLIPGINWCQKNDVSKNNCKIPGVLQQEVYLYFMKTVFHNCVFARLK